MTDFVYIEFECEWCREMISLHLGAEADETVTCGCDGIEWYLCPARVRRATGAIELVDFQASAVGTVDDSTWRC